MQEDEKELRKLSMEDLIILFFNAISARCWARLGLTRDEYGEMYQDLKQARLAIDVLDAVVKVLNDNINPEEYKEMEAILANLKLNYFNQYNKVKEGKT